MTVHTDTAADTATATSAGTTGLVVRRTIAASAQTLFDAWLDPASLATWMRPGTTTSATVRTDPRVGGTFEIAMHMPDVTMVHTGEYRVIDRPHRLSFTWISSATNGIATDVTVDFLPVDAGTEVVITHTALPEAEIAGHSAGWSGILVELDAAFPAS
jgi:uncharacterized protein YndB with AHSA1/START domain